MKAFFKAQFNCPIIWMFHSPSLNNNINRLDERCLRKELLVKGNSVSIHYNNIHTLAIEMYRVVNDISSEIMNIFKVRN